MADRTILGSSNALWKSGPPDPFLAYTGWAKKSKHL